MASILSSSMLGGKGNKMTRLRPSGSILPTEGNKTPKDIALGRLSGALEQYGLTQQQRRDILSIASEISNLRVLSMNVLAGAFIYIRGNARAEVLYPQDYSPFAQYGNNNSAYYIINNRLLSPSVEDKLDPDELETVKKRMAATLLRYIFLVSKVMNIEISV